MLEGLKKVLERYEDSKMKFSDAAYLKSLKKLRKHVQHAPFNAIDCEDIGSKETTCSWGMCCSDPRVFTDMDQLLFDRGTNNSNVAPKYRQDHQACPHDTKRTGGGCFYVCAYKDLFNKRSPEPSRKEALARIDTCIKEFKASHPVPPVTLNTLWQPILTSLRRVRDFFERKLFERECAQHKKDQHETNFMRKTRNLFGIEKAMMKRAFIKRNGRILSSEAERLLFFVRRYRGDQACTFVSHLHKVAVQGGISFQNPDEYGEFLEEHYPGRARKFKEKKHA